MWYELGIVGLVLFLPWFFRLPAKYRISKCLGKLKSPMGLPMLGNLLQQGQHVDNHYRWKLALFEEFGDTFAMQVDILSDGAICTRNPKNVEHILHPKHSHKYNKPGMMQHALRELMGNGIFNINTKNSSWAHQRGDMKRFVASNLREYRRVAEIPTNELMDTIQRDAVDSGDSIEIESLLLELTTKYTYHLAFGMQVDSSQLNFHDLFKQASRLSVTRFTRPWYRLFGQCMASERQLKHVMVQINAICKDLIAKKRLACASTTETSVGLDLLSHVLKGNDDEYVRDMIMTMMLAGRETLASGLMWVLYIVSKHPQVEAKLVLELGKSAGDESNDYLEKVIRETFRLFPPTPYELKCAMESDKWPDGTEVPAGTNIEFSAFVMGRSAAIWGHNPERFDPERWNELTISDYENPVFNAGNRSCPGQRLAIRQMKLVLRKLYSRFSFELVAPLDEPVFVLGIGLFAKGGIVMKARTR